MPHLPKKLLLYSFFPIIVTQLTPVYFGRSNGTTTNISSTFTQYIQGRWCSQTMVYNQPYTARTDGRWCPVFVGFDVPSFDRAHSFSLLLWFVAQSVRASVFSVWVWPSMEWIACRTSWCVHPYQKTPRGWHALYCNRSNHGGDGECSAVSDCTANGTLSKYSICEHQQCYTVLPVLLRL